MTDHYITDLIFARLDTSMTTAIQWLLLRALKLLISMDIEVFQQQPTHI